MNPGELIITDSIVCIDFSTMLRNDDCWYHDQDSLKKYLNRQLYKIDVIFGQIV